MKSLIPVILGQKGLSTKWEPKVVQGEMLDLQNATFEHPGAFSKRNGYDCLTTNAILQNGVVFDGYTVSDGYALNNYNDELLLFDGYLGYSYSDQNQIWNSRGVAISAILEFRDIIRNNYQQKNPDVLFYHVPSSAPNSGYEFYAWEDSSDGKVHWSSYDSVTKSILANATPVTLNFASGSAQPRWIEYNGAILLFYTTGANINVSVIDPAAPYQAVYTQTIITNLSTGHPVYDICLQNDTLAVSYYNGGVLGLVTRFYSGNPIVPPFTGLLIDTTSMPEVLPYFPVFLTSFTDAHSNLYLIEGYSDGTATSNAILTSSVIDTNRNILTDHLVVNTTANANIYRCCAYQKDADIASNTINVVGEYADGYLTEAYNHYLKSFTVTSAGSIGVGSFNFKSVGLYSRPFKVNGLDFLTVAYESSLQPNYLVLNTTNNIIAQINYTQGGGLRTNSTLCNSPFTSDSRLIVPVGIKGPLLSDSAVPSSIGYTLLGLGSMYVDFSKPNQFLSSQLSNNMIFVGGILQSYDGARFAEHGFLLYPENITTTTGSDGYMSAGSYLYKVIFEAPDNVGNTQLSGVSIPVSVTVGANGSVTLTGSTLKLTNKTCNIAIYRTEVGLAQNYYRVTSQLTPLVNDPNVNYWTYKDTLSDGYILSAPLLYTTGEVLENFTPPPSSLITSYRNRIFLAGSPDKNMLSFSKEVINGVPAEFPVEFSLNLTPEGGPITALGTLDEKLIIFKNSRVYQLIGNGPNNQGENNDYTTPQLITSDVGCTNPNSLVIMPDGLMFKSEKGIQLLDRSLGMDYIGADVERFNDLTITSATLVSDDNQVRFGTSDGYTLVYDYFVKQWSTFTNMESTDSLMWQNQFVYLRANGKVQIENDTFIDYASVDDDTGVPVLMNWTTGWFDTSGILQSFKRIVRVYLLGGYKGPHILNVGINYNFVDDQTDYLVPDVDYSPYQVRIYLSKQKCESFQLVVTESQESGFGVGPFGVGPFGAIESNEGYTITGLLFEVVPKRGGFKYVSQIGS